MPILRAGRGGGRMESAAERFYRKSHATNLRDGGKSAGDDAAEAAAIDRPSHRYYPLARHLDEQVGQNVVELGYGSSVMANALAGKASSYTIVDVVKRHGDLDVAENIRFVQSDLNNDFPFQDEQFDCVAAMMVFEHLFDPFHSFREARRIVRPGGAVIVNLPNIASIRCRLQLLRGKMPVTSSADWFEKEEWDGNHLHSFTIDDTLRLARHVGLKFVSLYAVGNHLWLKSLAPGFFCHEIGYVFERP